jgi:hypothetical protein
VKRIRVVCILFVAALMLTVRHVHADESAAPEPSLLALEGAAGMGSPGGLLAVGLALRPLRYAAIAAGVGLGWDGLQTYAGVRAHPLTFGLRETVRLGFGAGWSQGRYGTDLSSREIYYWSHAHWLNLETYVSIRLGNFGELRPFVGAAFVLNPASAICPARSLYSPAPCKRPSIWGLPSIGMSLSVDLF